MSDVVHHTDIEDVLSSVRRLVANDEEQVPAAQNQASTAETDALVLTAAFRVAPEQQADSEVAVSEASDNSVPFRLSKRAATAVAEGRWDGANLEDRIAELEAAVSRTEQDWEPDGSETAPPPETFDELEMVDLPERPDPFVPEWTPEVTCEEPSEEELLSVEDMIEDDAVEMAAEQVAARAPAASSAIDDKALRGLVMSILQDEMQGALGDRICTEIRKLVDHGSDKPAEG